MHATIRLSESETYQLPLFKTPPTTTSSVYKLAMRILALVELTAWAVGAVILSPIILTGALICCFLDYVNSSKKEVPAHIKALQTGKIHSVAYAHINHSYAKAPKAQKEALEAHIVEELKKHDDPKIAGLSEEQKSLLAHEIANNPKIYDKGGLCLPYSWLFAAYVLKHQDSFKGAQDLKDRFVEDMSTKTAPPLIAFARFVDVKALVKTEGDAIVVEAQKLHKPFQSIENAYKIMEKLGYSSFKKVPGSIENQITALEKKIDSYPPIRTLEQSESLVADMNHLTDLIRSSLDRQEEGSLEEKILKYGKDYDAYAFDLGIPTHAMSFYTNAKKDRFIFFDSNLGVVNFASLEDLAKGVSKYIEVRYEVQKSDCTSVDVISS